MDWAAKGMRIRRSAAEVVDVVRARLRERGQTVKPGSRLDLGARALERLVRADQRAALSPSTLRDAQEAFRDYTAFEFMLSLKNYPRPAAEFQKRLEQALRDGLHPCEHGAKTPGRDTQAELFLAAVLSNAALEVTLGTPDLRVRIDGSFLFVEVKRPRTFDGVENAVTKAVEQIKKTGCTGVVYLDLSLPFGRRFTPTAVEDDTEFQNLHITRIRECFIPHNAALESIVHSSPVVTVLVQCDWLRYVGGSSWILETQLCPFGNGGASKSMERRRRLFERAVQIGVGKACQAVPLSEDVVRPPSPPATRSSS